MPGFARQQRIITVMILFSLLLSVMISTTFAQEDNLCRDTAAVYIEDGETLTGTLDPNFPATFFCYEGERATEVTITIEHISSNLNTFLFVGTPFFDEEEGFVDPEILFEESLGRSEYEGTVTLSEDGTYLIVVQGEQNVQGAFLITLEESAGLCLGCDPDDADSESDSGEPLELDELIPGESDLCNTVITQDIAIGETVEESTVDLIFYCFDAAEGDVITVEVTNEDEIPLIFVVVDRYWSFDPNDTYAQGYAEVEGETATGEFLVQADGRYMIYVLAAEEGATGDFSITVTTSEANVYTCQNEPLSTLVRSSWGVTDADGNTILEINFGCGQLMVVSVMDIPQVVPYSITQDGELFFRFQDYIYVSESVSETEWTFVFPEIEQEYVLEPVSEEDACADEDLFLLVQGSWLWEDQNQSIIFDFTCNGIVIIEGQGGEPFPAGYVFDGEDIRINLGQDVLIFSDVNLNEERLTATGSGFVIELTNLLYDPDAVDSDVEAEATEEADSD